MDRYTRLMFASWYALLRYRESGSAWWEDRYLTIERERQELAQSLAGGK